MILFANKYGEKNLSHTVTEKGTVTSPAEIRKKYNLGKGSRVEFVETDEGILSPPSSWRTSSVQKEP
jgi:AbrB family looped-hinge helix DNA binding protein